MKEGFYDNRFNHAEVSADAHPDVLLQPQYCANVSIWAIKFVSSTEEGNNTILIHPATQTKGVAEIDFRHGENPLSGVPTNYIHYTVEYMNSAKPTTENIDSILQWKNAYTLRCRDRGDVAVTLFKRIDELSDLTKLRTLELSMEGDKPEQINVATFLNNLTGLRKLCFTFKDKTEKQVKEFELKNKIPLNWRSLVQQKHICYNKLETNTN